MLEINKIHLGDSYELIKQIPDKSIDCIYTDIPYLYQKGGASSTLLGQRMVKQRLALSEISNGIDFKILDEFIRISKKNKRIHMVFKSSNFRNYELL